jgi:hypothetical protein
MLTVGRKIACVASLLKQKKEPAEADSFDIEPD